MTTLCSGAPDGCETVLKMSARIGPSGSSSFFAGGTGAPNVLQDTRSVNSVKRYEDRVALILSWYDSWSAAKRWMLLQQLLEQSSEKHQSRMYRVLDASVPKKSLDFTRELPHHLCLKIFGLLDPRSLCRAAKVCWYWKILCEDNKIWREKCLRLGWGLPRPPLDHETGIWKRHYVMCVYNLHWVPPKDLPKGHKSELCDAEEVIDSSDSESAVSSVHSLPPKEPDIFAHSKSEKKLAPWRAPSKHPKDLQNKTILLTSTSDTGREVSKKTIKNDLSSSGLGAPTTSNPRLKPFSTASGAILGTVPEKKTSILKSKTDKKVPESRTDQDKRNTENLESSRLKQNGTSGNLILAGGNGGSLVQAWSGLCQLGEGVGSRAQEKSTALPPVVAEFQYYSEQSDSDGDM